MTTYRAFRILILLIILAGLSTCDTKKSEGINSLEVNILPYPSKILKRGGLINLSSNFWVIANLSDSISSELATYLVGSLKSLTGEDIRIIDLYSTRKHNQSILITIDKSINSISKESYVLDISSSQIELKSKSAQGIYYGIQTLLQLLKTGSNNSTYIIPNMVIKDSPRFPIRGVMLKSSQINNHSKEGLFKSMSALKINSVFIIDNGDRNILVKEITSKNYIKLFANNELLEDMTLISYGSSNLEIEEAYNSKLSGKDSHGLVLDLTSTNEEDILIKLIVLAELSWSANDKKGFNRLKQHIKEVGIIKLFNTK